MFILSLPKLSVAIVCKGSVKMQPPSLHSSLIFVRTVVRISSMSSFVTFTVTLFKAESSSVCFNVMQWFKTQKVEMLTGHDISLNLHLLPLSLKLFHRWFSQSLQQEKKQPSLLLKTEAEHLFQIKYFKFTHFVHYIIFVYAWFSS